MRVTDLYRYPVKGFSPEALSEVAIGTGEAMPHDRAFAIENGPSGFDPAAPVHISKMKFLVLAAEPRVAELASRFDAATATFTLSRGGTPLVSARLDSADGRAALETFIAGYFGDNLRGLPKVVHAAGHSFSDIGEKAVHIVNRASLRALEAAAGRSIDPLRFRANIYVEDLPPWAEFDLIGHKLQLGGLTLEPWHRTRRCAATMVDPATAIRDMEVPRLLMQHWGHTHFGIYARVIAGGRLAVGDRGTLIPADAPPPAA